MHIHVHQNNNNNNNRCIKSNINHFIINILYLVFYNNYHIINDFVIFTFTVLIKILCTYLMNKYKRMFHTKLNKINAFIF